MRLAVVETSPHGGLLHYAVQLGDALARRGHAVDLVTSRGNELARRTYAARWRAVLTPPVRSVRTPGSGPAYLVRRAAVAVRLARAWARVVWESRRGGYDAVITGSDVALLPAAVGALALTGLPGRPAVAFVCHNVRPFNRWAGENLYASTGPSAVLLRRIFARFDLVFVHGERSRAEFEATWPPVPLAVIPHGDERVLAGDPSPPAREERILFFGDWRKVKGLSVLMAAFDELARRRPSVRLTIAGTPAPADYDADAVRRWAAGHGDRVRLVDHYVPIEEVPAVFGQARVVVTPYLVGYQSGVVHLAMTMGRAVVSSDVGDLASVVADGETGRVVPPGDAEALAVALEEVVADYELAARLGAAGRARVLERSSWEVVAERVEAALQALLRERRASPDGRVASRSSSS